jgi:sugar/nucleoside kinase (ribokinase family)
VNSPTEKAGLLHSCDTTYLLIGHVTKDFLSDGSFVAGGTVTYAAMVAKRFGWRPVIVTAAASDFERPRYLEDVEWNILPSSETTTYRNEYGPHGRTQVVGPVARPIAGDDIPSHLHQAAVVHLCPVAQELEPAIARLFQDSLVVATPQGWMRYWNAQGIVSLGDWLKAEDILAQLGAAVVSVEDINHNWTLAEQWAKQIPILVITQDKDGCTVFSDGKKQSFAARPADVIDPTGAGDIFAAAFFIRLRESGDPGQAARFANIVASMALERPGPSGVPSRAEVEEYLTSSPGDN